MKCPSHLDRRNVDGYRSGRFAGWKPPLRVSIRFIQAYHLQRPGIGNAWTTTR